MRRLRRRTSDPVAAVVRTPEIPDAPDGVVQVCHPAWRGVRSSATAFGDPIVTADDLTDLLTALPALLERSVHTVVIQGWPPGAADFARGAERAGLRVLAVSHSAPSQHGVDAGEAEALDDALLLAREGTIARVGVVKAGVAESLGALGHPVTHVPNRVPDVSDHRRRSGVDADDDGPRSVGIFLFPMWRKNVTTQLLAAAELGWTPHVMADPGVAYLAGIGIRVHGELDRATFLDRFAAMHMNFNVTLSECHPMMPMESYRLGVPCLLSRTSDLFAAEPTLHALTTVADADDPHAIAAAARRLDAEREYAVAEAGRALDAIDAVGSRAWREFTRGT